MRVICTSMTASENISGVRFAKHVSGHMISEEISEAQGARFLTIDGFYHHADVAAPEEPAPSLDEQEAAGTRAQTRNDSEPTSGDDDVETERDAEDSDDESSDTGVDDEVEASGETTETKRQVGKSSRGKKKKK